MTAGRRSRFLALLQTSLVAVAFAMQLVASNAINPILPLYREHLGLSTVVLSLTFVLYVVSLVTGLALLAKPTFARHAPALVLLSLVALIVSDLLSLGLDPWAILIGRVFVGVAGGLATGAASALVVGTIGAAGRDVTTTGNLLGAVVGVVAAQAMVSHAGLDAPQLVFSGHAIVSAMILVVLAVLFVIRRRENARVLEHQTDALDLGPKVRRRMPAGGTDLLCTASVVWIASSAGVVYSATVFAELGQPLVQAVGPTLLLAASATGQLLSPLLTRIAPWISGMVAAAAGAAGFVAGALLAIPVIALVGFVLLGAGTGIAYRAALVTLTRGTSSARQGALASAFGAITYTANASAILLIGWLSDLVGLIEIATGAFTLIAIAALVALRWAPRLRDTVEPPRL